MTHSVISNKHGFLDDNVFHNPNKECGYTDESGKFLNRNDAYKHAHSNFLLHKDAAKEASNLTKHEYDDHELDAHELKSSSYWQQHPGSKYA